MKVQVASDAGEIIWERGQEAGLTSRAHLVDGTQLKIIDTLRTALEQAEGELRVSDNSD